MYVCMYTINVLHLGLIIVLLAYQIRSEVPVTKELHDHHCLSTVKWAGTGAHV